MNDASLTHIKEKGGEKEMKELVKVLKEKGLKKVKTEKTKQYTGLKVDGALCLCYFERKSGNFYQLPWDTRKIGSSDVNALADLVVNFAQWRKGHKITNEIGDFPVPEDMLVD